MPQADDTLHTEDDDLLEEEDTDLDDEDDTPEDTDDEEVDDDSDPNDDPKEAKKKASEEAQKAAWLRDIRSGKKKLEDMPSNLSWLKPGVKKELEKDPGKAPQKKVKQDEVSLAVKRELAAERENESFQELAEAIEKANLDESVLGSMKEVYEDLVNDGVSEYKALKIACKAAGGKDADTLLREKRKKGFTLPPQGGQSRSVGKKEAKEKLNEVESKFMSSLPKAFKP